MTGRGAGPPPGDFPGQWTLLPLRQGASKPLREGTSLPLREGTSLPLRGGGGLHFAGVAAKVDFDDTGIGGNFGR